MDAASTLVFMILFVSFLTTRCKSEIFIEKPLLCIAFFRAQLLRQGPDSQVKRASTRKTKTLNVLVRLTSECRNKHVYCLFPWKGENPSITMFCLICLYSCTYNDEKTNQVPIFFARQTSIYHCYLDIEPWIHCVLLFVKMFNLVCDALAWCFKYKTFYLGMNWWIN